MLALCTVPLDDDDDDDDGDDGDDGDDDDDDDDDVDDDDVDDDDVDDDDDGDDGDGSGGGGKEVLDDDNDYDIMRMILMMISKENNSHLLDSLTTMLQQVSFTCTFVFLFRVDPDGSVTLKLNPDPEGKWDTETLADKARSPKTNSKLKDMGGITVVTSGFGDY
ncbi:hypothetical protein PoB_005102300, partial [Plakobranchus ocellatus]